MSKKLSYIFGGILIFISLINLITAVPNIQINSPQNITYNTTKISINVVSDEFVDFYFKDQRTGEKITLAENVTNLDSYLYVNTGEYKFDIFAENSNGDVNANVNFETTAHNPINITNCGYLLSSNTKYVLGKNISTTGYQCINMRQQRNSTLDLNGYTIDAGPNGRIGLSVWYASDIHVFNGSIIASPTSISSDYPFALRVWGTKIKFSNLKIEGHTGIEVEGAQDVIFQNIIVNSSYGLQLWDSFDLYFMNTTFIWNGYPTTYWSPTGILDLSGHSKVIFEESEIIGFPEYDFYLEGSYTDFYFRNTHFNSSKVKYQDWTSDTRFFLQHLLVINVTDQFNETGSGVIEVQDNGAFLNEGEVDFAKTLTNPTDHLLVATNEEGVSEVWVTEKLVYAKASSPAVITEYDFSMYNITARTWDSNTTTQLNLTGHQSTIPLSFTVNVPDAEKLPECTISQMLDLNNDGVVNIQDAVIILRKISGLPLSEQTESKGCEGINLNPL